MHGYETQYAGTDAIFGGQDTRKEIYGDGYWDR